MKKTKIDWCDCTVNPVIGCKNGCEYCYAKKINDRFHFIDKWNEPKFFPERLKQLDSKKPKSIFMDSMSDVGWWDKEWANEVYYSILKNPQHKYIFLTKCEKIYMPYYLFQGELQNRVFFGQSQTNGIISNNGYTEQHRDFISIEPLLGDITVNSFGAIKQVIIGAETGNRKGKIIPKKEWVDHIVEQCDKANVRVFMKSSLKEIMGNDFRQDKLIWEIEDDKR